jgi:hypothetical protein
MLQSSEQSKMIGSDGRCFYGFRVACQVDFGNIVDANGVLRLGLPFKVKGGGFS